MRTSITLAASLLTVAYLNAQQNAPFHCGTGDAQRLAELTGNDPALLAAIAEADAELDAFTAEFGEQSAGARSTYVIPVVFHIIHNNGPENISDAQVLDAVRILNEDFNKLNADWPNVKPEFLGLVADCDIEFRLARKDPQGNCTNGITRTVSTLTYQGDQAMKNLIQWPRNRYMNVWISASAGGAGVAGYTQVPATAQFLAAADGIVVRHNYLGSIGTGSISGSRTLTHEVGHWINLQHPWGPSNEPGLASNCNTDDGVSDTPNTIGWTTCNLNGVSCGSLDNVENFMDYSFCSKMFTNGQASRMVAALNSATAQRNQLWQPANLTFTGVEGPPVLCAALFTSNSTTICAGGTVNFSDISYHGVQSRTWSFPGGNPSTSTDPNPTVTYSTPGTYEVSLTVSDGTSSLNNTANSYMTVLPNPGGTVPAVEGFEAYTSFTGTPWTVSNLNNNNTWSVTDVAAYSGSKSARILNTAAMDGQFDDLYSTSFDMSGATAVTISFRYAYARRNSSSDDRLRLYVSNNCGATWSMRRQLRGATDLNTGGITTGNFVPSGPEQWGQATVNNISNTFHTSDFRIRFEFESNGGNNVYIDDININGMPVSVGELLPGQGDALMVLPNPAIDRADAVFNVRTSGPGTLELLDMLGRSVQVLHYGQLSAGDHRIGIPLQGLGSGLYFVRLQQGSQVRVVRLTVK